MSHDDSPPRIRILIVDDHLFVRESLRQWLSSQKDMEVVADTEFGEEAIRLVRELAPTVVLLDMVLETSRVNGQTVLTTILAESPATRVLILSAFSQENISFPAIQAGAHGYLLKNSHPRDVVSAVRNVVLSPYQISPELTRKIVTHLISERDLAQEPAALKQLTDREREVLKLALKNMSNQEIADELHIAVTTVKTHISNILGKLSLRNRGDLGLWWAQHIPLGRPD